MRPFWFAMTLIWIVGCASDVTVPGPKDLAGDHPASPRAPASALPPPSTTLTREPTLPAPSTAPMPMRHSPTGGDHER